jgi:hypothetical protein
MIDLGKKSLGIPESVNSENKKSYPCLYVPLELVKGKTVGDMVRVEIVGKVVGLREDEASIDVMKAEYLGKAGKATKEEYTKMTDAQREAHDKRNMDDESDTDTE